MFFFCRNNQYSAQSQIDISSFNEIIFYLNIMD